MTIENTDEITPELDEFESDDDNHEESGLEEGRDEGVDEGSEEESPAVNPHSLAVDQEQLRKIIEGALLAAGQPLTVARLLELFDEKVAPTKEDVLAALQAIEIACEERGFELKEVASGWRFQVREGLAPWVNRMWEEKPQKYSRALLETLSLIAYRQPITRGDIEEIRGVAVSSHIMKTLMEREWVKVVGHRDVPGRPSLYATTRQFLDYFNLKSLEDLPSLSEIRDLDEMNPVLNLGGDEEGLGEPDTDAPIPDNPDTAIEDDVIEDSLEEFVEGEDAFEIIEDSSRDLVDDGASLSDTTDTNPAADAANEDEEPRND
ncbi:MAG TPA: SMC-Scp complex subunit ScpB [Cellvibrio sp.]|nr:SMC-Scp complex subunit ScpB [Cellvibrio sp.]